MQSWRHSYEEHFAIGCQSCPDSRLGFRCQLSSNDVTLRLTFINFIIKLAIGYRTVLYLFATTSDILRTHQLSQVSDCRSQYQFYLIKLKVCRVKSDTIALEYHLNHQTLD